MVERKGPMGRKGYDGPTVEIDDWPREDRETLVKAHEESVGGEHKGPIGPRVVPVSGIARRAGTDEPGRPETGAMQFAGDWPGLFIRGDNAQGYLDAIEAILRTLEQGSVPPMHQISELRALRDDLRLPLAKDEAVQALLAYAACKAPKP